MTPRLRRIASIALVAGGVAVVLSLAPKTPKSRLVDFRIDEGAASVVRLDVSWSRLDEAPGTEPVLGSSFRFAVGDAPKIIHTTVNLPDGSYALDITLERADRAVLLQRVVRLGDADQITVPLR